jgi:hypothetical protein
MKPWCLCDRLVLTIQLPILLEVSWSGGWVSRIRASHRLGVCAWTQVPSSSRLPVLCCPPCSAPQSPGPLWCTL